MDKLISSNALISALRDDPAINGANLRRVIQHIEDAPAVDAVVHGRWLNAQVETGDPFGYDTYEIDVFSCSVCGVHFDVSEAQNYCPNCGAKMDGGNEDEKQV